MGSNYTFVVENETINGVPVTNSFSVFGTNVYSIAYTFVPGYNYFITVNYSASVAGTVVGLGMSLGTAGYTNNFSQMGSAMSSTYSGGGNSSSMGRTLASGMGSGFNSGAGLSIFPNPADYMVNVALPDSVNVTRALITLSDIYGRQLKKVTTVSSVNPISLSGLAAGLYLVQVYDGKKLVSTSKIVKK